MSKIAAKKKVIKVTRRKVSNGDTYETHYAADGKTIRVFRANVMDGIGLLPNRLRPKTMDGKCFYRDENGRAKFTDSADGVPDGVLYHEEEEETAEDNAAPQTVANTINATATAQASVRSPLTANKTVKGIVPGSGQSSPLNTRPGVRQTNEKSWNPSQEKMKKIAQTSGQMRGLESALDRAIRHAMDFRWNGPRVTDAMSEQFGAQAQTKIDPETAQRIEEEVNKADMLLQVLKSVDPAHPDIAVLPAEAERIVAALKELTQGHEAAEDSLEQSQIAAAQENEADIDTAAGLSGGAHVNMTRETAANAHKDRPEAAFSSGLEGPNGRHAWGHAGQEQSQAFVDYMAGKDQQTEPQESDVDRIERTRAAYERASAA